VKIALVGPFPPQEKGEAAYLQRSCEALADFIGPENITIISQYENRPSATRFNGSIVRRAIRDRTSAPSYAPQRELVRTVIESGADIVHVHFGPNQDYGGRLGEPLVGALRRLRRQGVKTVLTLHSQWKPQDVICSRPAQRFPALLRPLIVRYFRSFMRGLRASCDAFLCVVSILKSPLTAEFARAYGLHDIGEELFSCALEFTPVPKSAHPSIFAFGFMRPEKGFEVLIEAFLKYCNRGGPGRLIIAGSATTAADRRYVEMLRALCEGHDRITLIEGYLSDGDVHRYLHECSVFVVPYLRTVGCSAPLHAALGMGRPVIAAAVGHNAMLGEAVRLVAPASSEAIAHALSGLINVQGALEEAAERARHAAMERRPEIAAARQYELYRRLLEPSAHGGLQ